MNRSSNTPPGSETILSMLPSVVAVLEKLHGGQARVSVPGLGGMPQLSGTEPTRPRHPQCLPLHRQQ